MRAISNKFKRLQLMFAAAIVSLMGLMIVPRVSAQATTIWPSTATPAVSAFPNDTADVTLGFRFRAGLSVRGSISAVKVWRGADLNDNDLQVYLWDNSGNILGQGQAPLNDPFTSGWQTVELDTPVTLALNTAYVAGYYAPGGEYAYTHDYFCAGASVPQGGPLYPDLDTGCSNSSGHNGLYHYGTAAAFPTDSYMKSNYWVDVIFNPGVVAPVAPTKVVTERGNQAVALTWRASANADSYTVYWSTSATGVYEPVLTGVTTPYATITGLTNSTIYYFKVAAQNKGGLSGYSNVVSATPAQSTPYRLYPTSRIPSANANNDTNSVNLGQKFTAKTPGTLTSVRFYRQPGAGMEANRVYVYDASGIQIGSGIFIGEAHYDGWVRVNLNTPISLVPGKTYTVSYFSDGGRYSFDSNQLPADIGVAGALAGTGVFAYGSAGQYPNSNWQTQITYAVTPEIQIGTITNFGVVGDNF